MGDLTNPKLIYLKGGLFLVCGLLSATVLLMDDLNLRTIALLLLTIWCFCRFYYFAFYVIEHYVDPGFKFAGLLAFARYVLSKEEKELNAEATETQRPQRQEIHS